MLRQGHLRNGASLRPNGPGESEVVESSECDKDMTGVRGSACNDKTFSEYLILGGKRKAELSTVEKEEKRLAKNKRAKETRENKKKLLPSKSIMRSGGPSDKDLGGMGSIEDAIGLGDVDKLSAEEQHAQHCSEQGVGKSFIETGRETMNPGQAN